MSLINSLKLRLKERKKKTSKEEEIKLYYFHDQLKHQCRKKSKHVQLDKQAINNMNQLINKETNKNQSINFFFLKKMKIKEIKFYRTCPSKNFLIISFP